MEDIRIAQSTLQSKTPSLNVGKWVVGSNDWLQTGFSDRHVKCLEKERQGNCHRYKNIRCDSTSNCFSIQNNCSGIPRGVLKTITNSLDILNGAPTQVWESSNVHYKPWNGTITELRIFLRSLRGKIYIVGDSLSRQFAHSLSCTLEHKLNIKGFVTYKPMALPTTRQVVQIVSNLRDHDIIVVNFGRHIDPSKPMGNMWEIYFNKTTDTWLSTLKKRNIRANNVYFRTTDTRFVQVNGDDWNSGRMMFCGKNSSDNFASQQEFKGISRRQNQILFDKLLLAHVPYKILDVYPVSISRSDATYDCSHYCLPGPIDTWSSIFLNKLVTT
jgi:hypothetical protein